VVPFQEATVDDLRREFASLALTDGSNISALCRAFGISRSHGYAIVRAVRSGGLEAAARQSRRPTHSPARTPASVEAEVIALRAQHPAWGARKLRAWLLAHDRPAPAKSTITALLHRAGLIETERRPTASFTRFEHPQPNDLWQMDFMGHRPLRSGRVYPLAILDDHSRYGLVLEACGDQLGASVRTHLTRALQQYGLPWVLLTDNGPPWGSSSGARTRFEVALMRLGIQVIHGAPMHPQTQGKVERWHQTVGREVFGPIPFVDLAAAQRALDAFRQVYNEERPHEALADQPPRTHYQISGRPYPSRIPDPDYDTDEIIRSVQSKGHISWNGRHWRIGEAFSGQRVAIRPTGTDGLFRVVFYNQEVARIDLR